MNTYQLNMRYQNNRKAPIILILEPWAEQYLVQPGQTIDISATGGAVGSCFEVEQREECLIVFAWADCVVSVLSAGKILHPEVQ
jgi:hypothetical protein